MNLSLRYAARSDVGLVRDGNEDSGYAGPSLLAVADGMGGHAAGEVASSLAVSTMATLEDDVPSTELLDALAEAINAANDAISDMVEKHPKLDGMGTTLTALLWSGRRVGLVHVGDSRAYLLRDGAIQQITHDHTFVQQLIEEGRITAAEAAVHPQRSLLLRALDGRSNPEPDLSVREVHLGDRYLVCSDGLTGVVTDEALAAAMSGVDLETAADSLVQLALAGGGPDNITCIVADVVEADANASEHPLVVGAAAGKHLRAKPGQTTSEIDLTAIQAALATGGRRRPRLWVPALVVLAAVIVGLGGWGAYTWSQRQYYVGADTGKVAIYQGLPQQVIGQSLSDLYERQDITLTDLPAIEAQEVRDTIFADNLSEARKVVDRLRVSATECRQDRATAAAEQRAAETAEKAAKGRPGSTASPRATPAPTGVDTSIGALGQPLSPDATAAPDSTGDPTAGPAPGGPAEESCVPQGPPVSAS